jgi:hypothetical protein
VGAGTCSGSLIIGATNQAAVVDAIKVRLGRAGIIIQTYRPGLRKRTADELIPSVETEPTIRPLSLIPRSSVFKADATAIGDVTVPSGSPRKPKSFVP